MKLLAITLALSLFGGCVDQDGTPVGVDDIEDNSDDNFGPDTLKDDVNPTEPKPREQSVSCNLSTVECVEVALTAPKLNDRVIKGATTNTSPQRTDGVGRDPRIPAADITPQR